MPSPRGTGGTQAKQGLNLLYRAAIGACDDCVSSEWRGSGRSTAVGWHGLGVEGDGAPASGDAGQESGQVRRSRLVQLLVGRPHSPGRGLPGACGRSVDAGAW
jgi:hypothetical protein